MMVLFALVGLCALSSVLANPIERKADVALDLIILHNNDMHARFEQTSKTSGTCTPSDANSNKCYGGFARVAYEVRKYRQEAANGGQPVLYLNAGDTYTGTPWFTVFKDKIATAFLNKLMPDAISLGNHEFDEGVDGLVPFLNDVEFPVVAANLDLSKTPQLAATKQLTNHTILEVNGFKIGIIGYITPDTEFLVKPNDVRFINEIDAINEEAAKLKAAGIKIIIALGHSGYEKDQEIAAKCADVDLVIGGHSHTFLYSGKQPDSEAAEGPYPTIVKRSNGVEVPVVQSYAYTKYLGKLHVQFDNDGNLIEFDGTPILLNASIPRESDVLQLLEVYRPNITALETETVGYTKVYLEGSAAVCRKQECNLGNLVADSMVFARVLEDQGGTYWTDAPISVMGGGGVRSSIDKRSDGSITGADLLTVLPFNNDLVMTEVYGKTLRASLEHSAYLRDKDSNGGFLQMSGVKVTYNFDNKDGSKVVDVKVRCNQCNVPQYEQLNDTRLYKIIVTQFVYDGGDGHVLKEDFTKPVKLQMNDVAALRAFIQQRKYVYPEVDDRITSFGSGTGSTISKSLFAILVAFVLRGIL